MLSLLTLLMGSSVLAAEEDGSEDPADATVRPVPAADDDRPLAIPAPATPPPRPPERVEIEASPRPSDARKGREFARRRLSVREPLGLRSWPPPWGGPMMWEGWAVYEGASWLDVPTTLDVLGRTEDARRLRGRIRGNRVASTSLYGLGVLGVAASVVGLVGRDHAATFDEARDWAALGNVGLGVTIGGFLLGTVPSNRARRLQYVPATTLDLSRVRDDVEVYNSRLATELGLGVGGD